MTIPIVPGPFSFLASAGEAYAGFHEGKRKRELENFAQAIQRYQLVYQGVKEGILPRSTLSSKETTGLLEQIMGSPMMVDVVPNPQEDIARGQSGLIKEILGDTQAEVPVFGQPSVAPQRVKVPGARTPAGRQLLATGKIPLPSEVAGEQVAAASAEAAVPEAGTTARATQIGVQQKAYDDIADRVVGAYFAKNNKLPSPAQAARYGTEDTDVKKFQDQFNEQRYGAAIERLRGQLEEERTRRSFAAAQFQRAGPASQHIQNLIRQQNALTSKNNNRRGQLAELAKNLSVVARQGLVPRDRMSPQDQQVVARMEALQQEIDTDADISQRYEQEVARLTLDPTAQPNLFLNVTKGSTTNAPVGGRAQTRLAPAVVDQIVERIRSKKATFADVAKEVNAGRISPEDAETIRQRLGAK